MASFVKFSLLVLGLVGLSQGGYVSYGSSPVVVPSYSTSDDYAIPVSGGYSAPAYSAPVYSAPVYSAPAYSTPVISVPYAAPSYSAPSYVAPLSSSASASASYNSSPASSYGGILKLAAQPLSVPHSIGGPINYQIAISPSANAPSGYGVGSSY